MIPVPQANLDELARAYHVPPGDLRLYAGGREESDGVLYAYQAGAEPRLLKVLAIPVSNERLGLFCFEERMRFMRFLGDRGASIVFPLDSPHGHLYELTRSDSHVWVGYSMRQMPGVIRGPQEWDPAFFRQWGQAVGMMHRLTQEYPAWEASVDPRDGKRYLTWREEWQGFYEWCPAAAVKEKWTSIKERLELLPATRDSFGFIHNDPHLWNILSDATGLTVLDFDVANHHWFMTDITIACQSILFAQTGGMDRPVHDRARLTAFLGLFREGYERENQLAPEWWGQLDLFIAYRRILLFTVMHGWISADVKRLAAWRAMIKNEPAVAGN